MVRKELKFLNKKYIKIFAIVFLFFVLILNISPKQEENLSQGDLSGATKYSKKEQNPNQASSENFILDNLSFVETDKKEEPIDRKKEDNSLNITPLYNTKESYEVVKVVDGDTLDVDINGKIERLRLIGINTPETVDPRKQVECFGKEASNKSKETLLGKKIFLESDPSQDERDKYGRLLRYVFLSDGSNFNLMMIKDGFAYEYTYYLPYKYQKEFKEAQKYAQDNKMGLWGDVCSLKVDNQTSNNIQNTSIPNNLCNIKGNISTKKEKIYHLVNCKSYDATVIDESAGEKWFCSEEEALSSGWRKALNCE